MNRIYVIAVDFDGTLHDNGKPYPQIGEARKDIIDELIARQKDGAKLILWTRRENGPLRAAINWCTKHGLKFDAINDNLPELIKLWGNNPRKVAADEYWDDKAVRLCDILGLENPRELQGGDGKVNKQDGGDNDADNLSRP